MKVSPKQIINSLKSVVGSVYKEGVDQILSWPQTDERGYLKFRFRGGIQVYDCEISPEGIISYIEAQRSDSILLGSYFGPIAQYIEDSTYAQGLIEAEIMRIDGKKCKIGKSCGNTCITVNAKCSRMLGLKQKQVINNIREAVSQKAEKAENKPNGWGVAAAIGAGVVGTALIGGGVAGAIALSGGFGGGNGKTSSPPPNSPPPSGQPKKKSGKSKQEEDLGVDPPFSPPPNQPGQPQSPPPNPGKESSSSSKVNLIKDKNGYKIADESSARQLLNESLDTVESIIRQPLGKVRSVPVKLISERETINASYVMGVSFKTGKITSAEFNLNPNRVFDVETKEEAIGLAKESLIHEIGHAIDHNIFGGDQMGTGTVDIYGDQEDKLRNPRLKNLMDTIDNSNAIKKIKEGKNKDKGLKDHYEYLDQPTEKFARSFSQYIANKSNDPHLKQAIQESMGAYAIQYQWEKKDFEPIEKEFDKLFAR